MVNRTELDVRIVDHAARITRAERFGPLYPVSRHECRGPRRFIAALLLRLSGWLAPEQTGQPSASDAAIA